MTLITLSIWVYTIGGVLQLFFKEKHKCNFLIFMNFIAAGLVFKPIVSILYDRNILETTVYMGQLLKDVAFRVDALSAFFIMIICGVGLLGTIYSKKYLEPYIEQGKKLGSHLFLFNVFHQSLCGHPLMAAVFLECLHCRRHFDDFPKMAPVRVAPQYLYYLMSHRI